MVGNDGAHPWVSSWFADDSDTAAIEHSVPKLAGRYPAATTPQPSHILHFDG
jgi:hypothetical protein